jgi:hypothetical protein
MLDARDSRDIEGCLIDRLGRAWHIHGGTPASTGQANHPPRYVPKPSVVETITDQQAIDGTLTLGFVDQSFSLTKGKQSLPLASRSNR